jgi:hypothetical protein
VTDDEPMREKERKRESESEIQQQQQQQQVTYDERAILSMCRVVFVSFVAEQEEKTRFNRLLHKAFFVSYIN